MFKLISLNKKPGYYGLSRYKNIVCDGLIQSFRQNEMLIGKAISLLRKVIKSAHLK